MAVSSLPRADYTDRFGTTSAGTHTAEAWARAAFEPASPTDSRQLVWRRVLQLRLGALDDPGRVAGWEVADNRPGRLVLAAQSWHLTARLVYVADAERVEVTTRVTFRRLPGRLLWSAVGPVHRRAVPQLLAAASIRLQR